MLCFKCHRFKSFFRFTTKEDNLDWLTSFTTQQKEHIASELAVLIYDTQRRIFQLHFKYRGVTFPSSEKYWLFNIHSGPPANWKVEIKHVLNWVKIKHSAHFYKIKFYDLGWTDNKMKSFILISQKKVSIL